MIEKLEFQGKLWQVKSKVEGHRIDDPNSLKIQYDCDLVIRNNQDVYFILDEILDVEFEEL